MPRYFFNIRDGQPILTDNIGIDLPDLDAAIEEAHKEADLVVGALRNARVATGSTGSHQ
jgi:hypothetical protein